jgi:hypothetical protein
MFWGTNGRKACIQRAAADVDTEAAGDLELEYVGPVGPNVFVFTFGNAASDANCVLALARRR